MKPTKPDPVFLEYWNEVDDLMVALYGIGTDDAGIKLQAIAEAQDAAWTPREFVLWFGEKRDLTKLPGAA
jgi:hypothetical protein